MQSQKLFLASDNWAPAHPLIVEALVKANQGHAASYGDDAWTAEAMQAILHAFQSNCKVIFVPTGTGSNTLALKLTCRGHESVICADSAHIQYQESGAAEAIVGCKLLTVHNVEGKIAPNGIRKKLKSERAFGKHSTAPRLISISQPTEVGTIYSLEELASLAKLCKEEGLLFHIDGSRLYNAAAALNCPLHALTEASQADLLSLGGTKNGLLGAEALLIFNPALQEGSDHQQKQSLQLLSKMRYLSAQYIPFFKNELWRVLAQQANQKAREIASIIQAIPPLALSYPVETNQIFFTGPASWIPLIQQKVFCHLWSQEKHELRLIASWDTSGRELLDLQAILAAIQMDKGT